MRAEVPVEQAHEFGTVGGHTFFAAGGLASINFELANAALFSAAQSGNVLLATFIGGTRYFIGPILGAVLVNFAKSWFTGALPEFWLFALGGLFLAVTLFLPRGLAGLFERKVAKGNGHVPAVQPEAAE